MVDVVDPTTLKTAADQILTLLEDAADLTGWSPARHCVTNGPPSVECDSIFVWSDSIIPTRDTPGSGCHIVLRTQFQYVVAVCVGTVNCDPSGAALMHDTAWGIEAAFVQAVMDGALCPVAEVCGSIRWGPFTLLTNDGGYSWWQGSVQVDLSPEELAS